MFQTATNQDEELVSVAVLALAESEYNQRESAERAVELLSHKSPEVRRVARQGLRLAHPANIEYQLRGLLGRLNWNRTTAAALDVLAFHRLPLEVELAKVPDDDCDDVAWSLVEAGGRIPGTWTVDHLVFFLKNFSMRVREAALRASARSGISELLNTCREALKSGGPPEAIAFLGVVGSVEDQLGLEGAASNPALTGPALEGLGRLGHPTTIDFLLEFLSHPEWTETAAEAFERITGVPVVRGAPPSPPENLTEDELDLWEPVAPIDVSATRAWWKANSHRFDPSKRWQAGLNVSDDPLGEVFDRLPMNARYDVYLRQRALVPGTPDWELETWPWKQKNPGGNATIYS
jgi:HEAT repeat protein